MRASAATARHRRKFKPKRMLKERVLTAVALVATFLVVLYALPQTIGIAVWAAVMMLAAWEWAALGGIAGFWSRVGYAACMGLVLVGLYEWANAPVRLRWVYAAACLWWLVAAMWLALAPRFRSPRLVLACGVPVIVPGFIAIASIYSARAGVVHGASAVLWLFSWVFSADIGAYIAGRAIGRRKLAPSISPSKTWEGVGGGVILSSVFALAGAIRFGLPLLPVMLFGIVLVTLSIVGDLTESMFKRGVGLKDSGGMLPGHGGVMDRIDSLTAAAPLYALGLSAIGGHS